MKDTDLRGIMLQQFYDRRREGTLGWSINNLPELTFPADVDQQDMLRICDQLGEHNLIDWKPLRQRMGETVGGAGKINANGIDIIEEGARPPIAMHFDQSVTVNNSTGVQVARDNAIQQQTVTHHVEQLIREIESAEASSEEKAKAKSKLAEFLNTPVGRTIVGGALGSLLKLLVF